MEEALVPWHDFNVALVTAAAALLGLLFVALSIHIRTLVQPRNAELRSVARTVFLGYVVSLAIGFLALRAEYCVRPAPNFRPVAVRRSWYFVRAPLVPIHRSHRGIINARNRLASQFL